MFTARSPLPANPGRAVNAPADNYMLTKMRATAQAIVDGAVADPRAALAAWKPDASHGTTVRRHYADLATALFGA